MCLFRDAPERAHVTSSNRQPRPRPNYDQPAIRRHVRDDWGIDDLICAKRRPNHRTRRGRKTPVPLGMRWPIERTNSWLSNFGQLRRNTDRFIHQRLAQFALAIACIIIVKLIKWANRWNPTA